MLRPHPAVGSSEAMNALRYVALVLFALLLLAGCGGGDGARDDAAGQRDEQELEEAPPIEEPDGAGRAGGASFSLTPAIRTCMEQAGFTQDAPPTAALAAWRHPSGGRVVVASSEQDSVTGGIADELGGGGFEADVDGTLVVAAPDAPAEAARQCLDA